MSKLVVIITLLLFLGVNTAQAGPDRSFVPVAGSIKSHKVNVRVGPGMSYPILWVYKYRGYPVRAIARFGGWYQVRDIEGEEGWIYQNFFSTRKTGLISNGEPVTVYKDRDGKRPVLRLEAGVVVLVTRCALGLCEIEVSGKEGWINKNRLLQP